MVHSQAFISMGKVLLSFLTPIVFVYAFCLGPHPCFAEIFYLRSNEVYYNSTVSAFLFIAEETV
jgi:hypothetical protein